MGQKPEGETSFGTVMFSVGNLNTSNTLILHTRDCPHININIVIYSLQSDVAGTCDTEYTTAEKGWYNVVVKKSKNMLSCTNRHDSQTALQGIPYDSQSVSANFN